MVRTLKSKLRIIVTGYLAQYPLGGVAWDYVQYVVGFARMGHDVFYLEDTHQWPFSPISGGVAKTSDENVGYLSNLMDRFDLSDRWAYRFPWKSQWFGMTERRRLEVIQTADCLVNVSGSLAAPLEYRDIPRLIYIDSDPVFTQIKLAKGQTDFVRNVDCHDTHFSFGEQHSDHVPDTGHKWIPTRQPVVIEEWVHNFIPRDVFTTIMNWTSYKDLTFQGATYGQKDIEFDRFMSLPALVAPETLEVAVNDGKTRRTPRSSLLANGWQVVNPNKVCPDLDTYRKYVQKSKAEWSVAKNGYVVGQAGWFSCRSACYLAAGRPVVVQDTGFRNVLPTGRGIVPFQTLDEAIEAIRDVTSRYAHHVNAASAISREYFSSERVLSNLLNRAFSTSQASEKSFGHESPTHWLV